MVALRTDYNCVTTLGLPCDSCHQYHERLEVEVMIQPNAPGDSHAGAHPFGIAYRFLCPENQQRVTVRLCLGELGRQLDQPRPWSAASW